jgi:hypothetical protein
VQTFALFRAQLSPVSTFFLLTLCALLVTSTAAQNVNETADLIWQPVAENNISARGERSLHPEKYRLFRLNRNELTKVLDSAPLEFSGASRENTIVLTVPKPDGKLVRFRLEESPILAPHIAAQFPAWKTYQGYGIDEPQTTARFDWTDTGFHAYVLATEGSFSIDPYQANDRENYMVFYKHEFGTPARSFHCKLDELLSDEKGLVESFAETTGFSPEFSHGTQVRNYRLAIATTFEYTNFFRQTGDSDAQAQERALNQVVTSVNRIDAVYRKELAISFTLVSGTNLTFVANPETPSDYANSGSSADLTANQANVDSVIGSANYDLSHLFETTDSGVASLGVVCSPSSKARGLSGQPNPVGDPFDVDYVAHEMGHQFAANHTFNATADCNSSPAIARREPGSAVTIMGYAGICASVSNVQRNSIDTFHVYNLTEAINFVTTGNGASCGTTSGANAAPVIAALSNYTIPFNTPFSLTASATDADGDAITYNWEQNDPSAATSNYPSTTDDDDTSLVFRPGFRSYLPTTSPTRNFPSLTYILNNSNEAPITFTGTSSTGSMCAAECISAEDLPSAARTMNFRVSVRDGRGGISDAGTVLTVINTTNPFKLTTQNSSPAVWTAGSTQTVTWDVSGTSAAPISAANVKISLSTDGGQTFPTVLAASTANDGSQNVTVPNSTTSTARIKVEAVGNIFFDINDVNFSISGAPGLRRFIDFDGDGKTDVSIFRPAAGQWWLNRSTAGIAVATFGVSTDILVPADYTGDGKTDIAFFRPSSGEWFILRSDDSSFYSVPFGTLGDIPAPGDFDGDGKADIAVFRAGTWYISKSTGGTTIQTFGVSTDKPVVADYDGDGRDDIAIYRPSVSEWWLLRSSAGLIAGTFGAVGDKTVPGDYTGDGKADVALWRPATGEWFILRSEDGSYFSLPFGASGDIPSPGDYDGDGKFDTTVFRPASNTWFSSQTTAGTVITPFGAAGDRSLPNAFVR